MRPVGVIATAAATAVALALGAFVWSRIDGGVPAVSPRSVRQPGAFREAPVTESSGIALSRRRPGMFWTMNDSGNPASLFLTDTLAAYHGFVSLEPILDVDWEALSAAPCGEDWCLYVGDIGDNRAVRKSVVIYRLGEPTDEDLAANRTGPVDSLVVTYPDGPEDAEALVATADGSLGIVTKGRDGSATTYWIDGSAWAAGSTVARRVGQLPFATSLILRRLVTDAALSPDGRRLAIRTYRSIYLYERGDGPLPDRPLTICDIDGLEPIGEGIAWYDDTTLVLTSEISRSRPGPVTLLQCPVP